MKAKITYQFVATIWQYTGPTGWHFVSLPRHITSEIRESLKFQEEGWGRMKATARIGQTEWETAIWFDTQHHTYLLPLKAAIRKKEALELNQPIQVTIGI